MLNVLLLSCCVLVTVFIHNRAFAWDVQYIVCFIFKLHRFTCFLAKQNGEVSNSLDPDETSSYSTSHLDPSCLHRAQRVGGEGVKHVHVNNFLKGNYFLSTYQSGFITGDSSDSLLIFLYDVFL